MLKTYRTVQGYGTQEIVIEKSRFISYVQRAESEEEANAFVERIKKKHWNATHNCSAYLIGENDQIQKANDDGEPSGTAGVPMLETLKKKALKDVVVVVTRYFGGIKLGAGGLVRAYTQSVTEGLKAAKIIERTLHQLIKVTIEYPLLGKIENELRNQTPYMIETIEYLEQVTLHVLVPIAKVSTFHELIANLSNGQAFIQDAGEAYVDTVVE